MFIRTKKSSKGESAYIQIVESYRERGRMRQRVVRHVGTAHTEEEELKLKQLALTIKVWLEQEILNKTGLTKPGRQGGELGTAKPLCQETLLRLNNIEEVARVVLGIHDCYGYVYNQLNFTNLFTRPRQRTKSAEILREIVLARIAHPDSKRSSVEILNAQFGKQIKLDHVYQMMDKIDEVFCERVQKQALSAALNLTDEKLKVLFYDATTLYFESFTEDELKQNGYSKDMKFNQPQVLLALFVTNKGFPVGYEVFPGKQFEGHTLVPMLEKLKASYHLNEVIFVADRGMLSKDNLSYLRQNNLYYIVGSRLKSLKKSQQKIIMDWVNSLDKKNTEKEVTHRIDLDDQQYLILSYRLSRAKKDKADREQAIQKLQVRLKRSSNPKQLISNYGYHKFIRIHGDAQLDIDESKLQEESIWDGVVGIVSNHPSLNHEQIFENYRGLWQVEESFRITKHDLQIRPIYHWTPKRIRAHIAIAFMSFVCVRYLEYRVAIQHKKISPEEIRKNLMLMQASVLKNKENNNKYLLPSSINTTIKHIYRVLGIKLNQTIMQINPT